MRLIAPTPGVWLNVTLQESHLNLALALLGMCCSNRLLTMSREGCAMRMIFLPALMLLAACDSPSPAMMGIAPTYVTVDGADFSVRRNDLQAEAIRTNAMPFPSIGAIVHRAGEAMEQATGCDVITDTLRGDQNVMRADLIC